MSSSSWPRLATVLVGHFYVQGFKSHTDRGESFSHRGEGAHRLRCSKVEHNTISDFSALKKLRKITIATRHSNYSGLYCLVLSCIVLYRAALCSMAWFVYTVLHCTTLFCSVLHCTVLHCTTLFCPVLPCFALYCIALHCSALYCTVLHCAALFCPVLHCTVLHCQFCPVLHCTFCSTLHCIALYCIALQFTETNCDAFHRTALLYPVFLVLCKVHCTALHYTVLFWSAMRCAVLYYSYCECNAMHLSSCLCPKGTYFLRPNQLLSCLENVDGVPPIKASKSTCWKCNTKTTFV